MHFKGLGTAPNSVLALDYYRKAGAAGYALSWWNTGLIYEYGQGIDPDLVKARDAYLKGAQIGHAGCQQKSGAFLLHGTGGEEDPAEGKRWLEKAAAQGNEEAGRLLAVLNVSPKNPGSEENPPESEE